jgi:hypothetical protein
MAPIEDAPAFEDPADGPDGRRRPPGLDGPGPVDGDRAVLAEGADLVEFPAEVQHVGFDLRRRPVHRAGERQMILPRDAVEVGGPRPPDPALDSAQAGPVLSSDCPEGGSCANGFYHGTAPTFLSSFLAMSPPPIAAVYSEYTDSKVVAHK